MQFNTSPHLLLVEGFAVVVQDGAECQAGVDGTLVQAVVQSHIDGRQLIPKLLLILRTERWRQRVRKRKKERESHDTKRKTEKSVGVLERTCKEISHAIR